MRDFDDLWSNKEEPIGIKAVVQKYVKWGDNSSKMYCVGLGLVMAGCIVGKAIENAVSLLVKERKADSE